jgi:hypothetical protein
MMSCVFLLFNKHCSGNKVVLNEMSRCGTCGEKRNAYGALEGKLERKRLLGRPRRR